MVKLAEQNADSAINCDADALTLDGKQRWIVLHTRSRQEKAVARCAAARRLRCYLPLIDRVSIIRNRRFVSKVPVFPGYVFLAGELDDAYDSAISPRICQIIHVPDQQRFTHELAQIQRALATSSALELYPFAVEGQHCRVVRGPFAGTEGVIVRRREWHRLVLEVNIIGRGVALEIDTDLLEPID